jgi:hypothetical protein
MVTFEIWINSTIFIQQVVKPALTLKKMNSFSANILSNTVDLVNAGLRDLRSNNLTTYTSPAAAVSNDDLRAQVTEVETFRSTEGTQAQSSAELASQISTPVSNERFRSLMSDAGLDSTYVEDLVVANSADLIPEVGAPTTFSQRKEDQGSSLSVKQIRTGLAQITAIINRLETPENSLHITQPDLRVRADENARVYTGNNQMLQYIRDYTKVGQ